MASQRLPLIVAALLVVSTVGCDTPVRPTRTDLRAVPRLTAPIAISGRALDFRTNLGVPDVTVKLGAFDSSGQIAAQASAVTNATGSYTLTIPPGSYLAQIGAAGFGQVHVSAGLGGDFLVNAGTCVSRYGYVVDMLTGAPLQGARVNLNGTIVNSDSSGWYRIDLGCPANGMVGFNTTIIVVSYPGYADRNQPVGRGVFGVDRLDLELGRRRVP